MINFPNSQPGKATLVRDTWGVAHIYAENEEDGFYALGYAQAEDELRGILLAYLGVRGELASVFGPDTIGEESVLFIEGTTIEHDLKVRRLRHLERAREEFPGMSLQTQKNMTAFIDGMSAFMKDHPEKMPAWAPPLEPVLPVALMDHLSCWSYGKGLAKLENTKKPEQNVPGAGSNAWVLAPHRTEEGVVVHLTDTHGGFDQKFSQWRIKAGDLDLFGFGWMGTVTPMFGHTPFNAWGWTTSDHDDCDCYRVVVDDNNPRAYTVDGEKKEMSVFPYTVRVRDGEDIRGEFEYTHHNNILSPVVHRENGVAYALSSPYLERPAQYHEQYRLMALAQDRDEFRQALDMRSIFPANLVAGGKDGMLLFIRPGRIPVRPEGLDISKPLDGNTRKTLWLGYHSLDDLIQWENPESGWLSINNISPDMMAPDSPIRAGDYPDYFSIQTGTTEHRQKRIIELLHNDYKLSRQDLFNVVFDSKIFGAEKWSAVIKQVVLQSTEFLEDRLDDFHVFVDDLIAFDGRLLAESRGALYYENFRHTLTFAFADQVNSVVRSIEFNDGTLTDDMAATVLKAIELAYDAVKEKFGTIDVTYGDDHRVGRGDTSLPAGGGAILGGYNLPGHAPFEGEIFGVVAKFAMALPLRVLGYLPGPNEHDPKQAFLGQRSPVLTIFSDPIQSYASIPTGASDDPQSPHYSDQSQLVSEARLRPTFFNKEELLGNIESMRELNTSPRDAAR